jgi:hypothetical protein
MVAKKQKIASTSTALPYLHDIYGKSKHFQLEKRIDLKTYYNGTNEILIDSFMEYPLDWFMRMEGNRRIQIRIG